MPRIVFKVNVIKKLTASLCFGTTKKLKNAAVQSNIERRLKTRQFSIGQREFKKLFQNFLLVLKNLVLWARSELSGSA
jgi:hypothetical protein